MIYDESIMTFKELLDLDIDNMKKIKYNAIRKQICHKLEKFMHYINTDDLDKAEKMLEESDGGDIGVYNRFLSFGDRPKVKEHYKGAYDLGDMLDKMKECKYAGKARGEGCK